MKDILVKEAGLTLGQWQRVHHVVVESGVAVAETREGEMISWWSTKATDGRYRF